MILHPWILGLIIGHSALLLVFSLGFVNAWQIFRGWDYNSTEEKQFLLEKKTYLVSTVMNFALFIQILMLFCLKWRLMNWQTFYPERCARWEHCHRTVTDSLYWTLK